MKEHISGRKKHTRTDFIDSIYETSGIDRKDVQDVLELFVGKIKDALASDGIIELRGFGTFEVKVRKGRKAARNPRTGETISVHAHGAVCFRPGRDLKKAVWVIDREGDGAVEPDGAGKAGQPSRGSPASPAPERA